MREGILRSFEDYYWGCDPYCSVGEYKARIAFSIIKGGPIGEFAEVGVYRGGFTMFLEKIASDIDVMVYGFDTFTGMPFKGAHDTHQVGDFVHEHSTFDSVSGRVGPNAKLVKGIFTEDIEGYDYPYAFVHLDADQYQSTIDGLRFFYPKLVMGGTILLDDYEWDACPGVKIALEEFGVPYTSLGTQAFLRKE